MVELAVSVSVCRSRGVGLDSRVGLLLGFSYDKFLIAVRSIEYGGFPPVLVKPVGVRCREHL